MNQQEIINTIALTRINYFNLVGMTELYRRCGSATTVLEHRNNIREIIPNASQKLVESFKNMGEAFRRAEAEYEHDMANGILPLCMNDHRYPQRLKECDDAPLVLFYRGTADLNQAKIISIVGTRHCTVYGQELIRQFISELHTLCPQVLIVSGLAYGIDICAHRHALQNGYETVGVLAHGLDYLYPPRHKPTADEMVKKGGLLTEFLTNTNADKINFVRRNRIVAGISDACILVESAAHGGGMITMKLARDYNRDAFAFPGAIGAPYSEGCNHLIRDQIAALITNAHDFVKAMRWENDALLLQAQQQGIERQLFPELTIEEKKVVDTLSLTNDLQINMLSVKTNIPIGNLTAILFNLEMKGAVKSLPGGIYHLIK
jgi:DNA processing protein